MTSSTSTGRCPSFISPPSRTNRIPSGSWKRIWSGARSRGPRRPWPAPAGPRAPCGRRPTGRAPRSPRGRATDEDGLAGEADRLAQVGRQQDPALLVHLGLGRGREDEPLEAARPRVGDRQRRDLRRSSSQPALVWIARQSSSQPETIDPGSSCARNLTGTAIRPLSSTVCRYSPVNTCRAYPCDIVGWVVGGFWGFPTSHHFVPLRCILAVKRPTSRWIRGPHGVRRCVRDGRGGRGDGTASLGRRREAARLVSAGVLAGYEPGS